MCPFGRFTTAAVLTELELGAFISFDFARGLGAVLGVFPPLGFDESATFAEVSFFIFSSSSS